LTIETLKKAAALLDMHERENRRVGVANLAAGLFNPFGGIRVFESELATAPEPVRKHRRTKRQSAQYHRRVQKKWAKRFGTVRKPAAFFVDGGRYGVGSGFVLHPEHAALLRQLAV
jgi:hypothetical protein